jgi:type IV pilus assembly protein PilW
MARLPHRPPRRELGMSLIDILVGMVIGLIGMIIVFQSFNAFEGQKRATTVTNDAQESGLMALTTIEREMRLAGYGMFYQNDTICTGYRQWVNNNPVQIDSFLPVVITNGASNASDSLTLTFSTSGFGATPSQVQVDFKGALPEIVVDNNIGNTVYKAGDYILVGRVGQACTRLQVSSVRTDPQNPRFLALKVEAGSTAPANPPADKLNLLLPAGGYTNDRVRPTVVANMGAMRRVSYAVNVDANHNGRLQVEDITAGTAPVAIADGILGMQAQYGISAATNTQEVSSWVDAAGSWAAPAFADQGRVKAIRIAVVARSQHYEKDELTGLDVVCNNTSGTNDKGPCAWRDTAGNPAPIFDLTGKSDWKHYRYRVYETIVPLRNVMWQY